MCGALAPVPQLALILAPIIIVLFMLFGGLSSFCFLFLFHLPLLTLLGFFISLSTIPPWYSWFGYLSFFRYVSDIPSGFSHLQLCDAGTGAK
jgi:hypothetical protein